MSENLVSYNKKYYQILPMNFRLIQKFVHRTIDWCFKQRFARDRIEEGNWLSSIGNNLSNIFLKTSATLKVSTHFFHTQYESRKKGRRERIGRCEHLCIIYVHTLRARILLTCKYSVVRANLISQFT